MIDSVRDPHQFSAFLARGCRVREQNELPRAPKWASTLPPYFHESCARSVKQLRPLRREPSHATSLCLCTITL